MIAFPRYQSGSSTDEEEKDSVKHSPAEFQIGAWHSVVELVNWWRSWPPESSLRNIFPAFVEKVTAKKTHKKMEAPRLPKSLRLSALALPSVGVFYFFLIEFSGFFFLISRGCSANGFDLV